MRIPPHLLTEARTAFYHHHPLAKMGRTPGAGEYMHVVGNFSGVEHARVAMGIDWMTRDGLREAIPPDYSHYIGAQLIEALELAA